MSWQLWKTLLSWLSDAIPWICGNRRRKDKISIEEDIESGSRTSPHGEVDSSKPLKEQIKPTIEELQASIRYVYAKHGVAVQFSRGMEMVTFAWPVTHALLLPFALLT